MPNRLQAGLALLALGISLAACRAGEAPGAGDPAAEVPAVQGQIAMDTPAETSPAALPEIRYYEIADT